MKKILCVVLALLLSATVLVACGGGGGGGDNGDATVIRVDLHGWTPTVNETSTAGSTAYNSPKYIAAEFEALHDNKVKIEWVRDKDLSLSREDVGQYFSLAISNGTCPAISFTWGTTFQERGWYVDLTSYLEEVNTYETAEDLAGKPWKEAFDDYIWSLDAISTYDGQIAAIPLTLFAGSASCVFYNVEKAKEYGFVDPNTPAGEYTLGITDPFDWTAYVDFASAAVSDGIQEGKRSYLLDSNNYPYTASSWLMQFNLGPAYMSYALDYEDPAEGKVDANGDGTVSGQEKLQAVVDGFFNPATKDYAREMLLKEKEYMNLLTDANSDATEWNNGEGALKYDGSWVYTPEVDANRAFDWEMVPAPVEDDSQYTQDYVDWVSFEESQPGVDLYLNVMRAGVTQDGTIDGPIDEDKLYYAVEFLKYLTTREANSAMIEEMNTSIGAVKGADLPMWLEDSAFIDCQFAKTDSVNGWPGGFTTSISTQMDTLFSQWVAGSYSGTDDQFFAAWNDLQVRGAKDMAASLGITLED